MLSFVLNNQYENSNLTTVYVQERNFPAPLQCKNRRLTYVTIDNNFNFDFSFVSCYSNIDIFDFMHLFFDTNGESKFKNILYEKMEKKVYETNFFSLSNFFFLLHPSPLTAPTAYEEKKIITEEFFFPNRIDLDSFIWKRCFNAFSIVIDASRQWCNTNIANMKYTNGCVRLR